MIFRRIKTHIEKENWFAVGVDFFIVVVGVFVGLQVQEWNEELGDQHEYQLALERLVDESKANIVVLNEIFIDETKSIKNARLGLETLQSCEHSLENVKLIEVGLAQITGTSTIHLQMSALDEITSSPHLLAQQDSISRKAFSSAKFNLAVLKAEADFSESLPFRDQPEKNTLLGLGTPIKSNSRYHGIVTTRVGYPLILNMSIDEICQDDQLLKSFYTWLRFQSAIPVYAVAMRSEIQNIIAAANVNEENPR